MSTPVEIKLLKSRSVEGIRYPAGCRVFIDCELASKLVAAGEASRDTTGCAEYLTRMLVDGGARHVNSDPR